MHLGAPVGALALPSTSAVEYVFWASCVHLKPHREVSVQRRNGRRLVTGGPQLQATQAYPAAFGRAIARVILSQSGPEIGKLGFGCLRLTLKMFERALQLDVHSFALGLDARSKIARI